MRSHDPDALLEAVRALPGGRLLLERLGRDPAPAVHLVGGAVRDLLLGRAPSELDLLVEGSARKVAELLGGRVKPHDRFGTVTVAVDGLSYDLASARRERYPEPGALPIVEPAGVEEDLLRRDFTVNAIALTLTGAGRGSLHAVEHAFTDLDHGRLRVLHERSFVDDPTRLLRLARYEARLKFVVELSTAALARRSVAAGALGTVTGPRLGNELRAIASEEDPVAALGALDEFGVDEAVGHGFGLGREGEALARSALGLMPADGRPGVLAVAVAARAIERARLRVLLSELSYDARERDVILDAATLAPVLASEMLAARRPSELADAIADASVELVAIAGALGAQEPARRWFADLRNVAVVVDGSDLIAAGIAPGPAIGAGLRAARSAALDGEATDRECQLAVAVRAARATG